jgi:hypothetical protein
MVRIPRSWPPMARMAGSLAATGATVRRIPVPAQGLYSGLVTVDLGNDGVAPTVIFSAAGTARAFCGPNVSGLSWALDQCFLQTSVGQLDPAQCIVYKGPQPVSTMAVTASLAGGGAQFGLGGLGVGFGEFVWALWTGGTPGATANLRVTGTKTAPTTTY